MSTAAAEALSEPTCRAGDADEEVAAPRYEPAGGPLLGADDQRGDR